MKNEKQRQTYYEAINYRTGKVILKRYPQGNTENTIKFIEYLIKQNKSAKLQKKLKCATTICAFGAAPGWTKA